MSILMKQGLLSWSHRHPHSLCRFFPTAFRAPQYAKPISPCTVFDTLNRTNLRRESKDGVFKQEVLTVVDFEVLPQVIALLGFFQKLIIRWMLCLYFIFIFSSFS